MITGQEDELKQYIKQQYDWAKSYEKLYKELVEEDNLNIDELFDWAQRETGRIERKLKVLNDETLNETEIKEVTEKIVEKSVKPSFHFASKIVGL